MSLTKQSLACLMAIDELTVKGVGPSYVELQDRLSVGSRSTIHRLVGQLQTYGYIVSDEHSNGTRAARGLHITARGEGVLAGNRNLTRLSNDALKQLARDVHAEIRRRTARVAA